MFLPFLAVCTGAVLVCHAQTCFIISRNYISDLRVWASLPLSIWCCVSKSEQIFFFLVYKRVVLAKTSKISHVTGFLYLKGCVTCLPVEENQDSAEITVKESLCWGYWRLTLRLASSFGNSSQGHTNSWFVPCSPGCDCWPCTLVMVLGSVITCRD